MFDAVVLYGTGEQEDSARYQQDTETFSWASDERLSSEEEEKEVLKKEAPSEGNAETTCINISSEAIASLDAVDIEMYRQLIESVGLAGHDPIYSYHHHRNNDNIKREESVGESEVASATITKSNTERSESTLATLPSEDDENAFPLFGPQEIAGPSQEKLDNSYGRGHCLRTLNRLDSAKLTRAILLLHKLRAEYRGSRDIISLTWAGRLFLESEEFSIPKTTTDFGDSGERRPIRILDDSVIYNKSKSRLGYGFRFSDLEKCLDRCCEIRVSGKVRSALIEHGRIFGRKKFQLVEAGTHGKGSTIHLSDVLGWGMEMVGNGESYLWIKTQFATYILGSPASMYDPVYDNLFKKTRLTNLLMVALIADRDATLDNLYRTCATPRLACTIGHQDASLQYSLPWEGSLIPPIFEELNELRKAYAILGPVVKFQVSPLRKKRVKEI
ncbi:hypothetical protein F5H01DRAFT_323270 [Linnemannia elongata]|nr:hypothetical protein F5H01DRAFT_323270 [Linnemannia elongata]